MVVANQGFGGGIFGTGWERLGRRGGVRCGGWPPRDSDHFFQVRALAMANRAIPARQDRAWAGTCAGELVPRFCQECGEPALCAAVGDAINAAFPREDGSPPLVQSGAALDAAPSVSAE